MQLMGRSFVEVMRVLMPNLVGDANVQIGRDAFFPVPVESLSDFAEVPAADETEPRPERFAAASRTDAVKLLAQVNAFYQAREPSSPVPFFTERARLFAGRDFLGLLKDVLPEDSLTSIE